MIRARRRLSLTRQTIRTLDDADLARVGGGGPSILAACDHLPPEPIINPHNLRAAAWVVRPGR